MGQRQSNNALKLKYGCMLFFGSCVCVCICACTDVVGGWLRGMARANGWYCNRKTRNACIRIDRFVINLFERLTRIYFWQTNFYLCRQSRKAFLFAKKHTHTERKKIKTTTHCHRRCRCRRQNRKMKHTFSFLVSVGSILRRGKPFRLKYLLK